MMMQGPAGARATITQAQRDAETLFETKNVIEIREIEARTRKDIADKSVQLRQRVGDSHRDLMEGADKIIDISRKCGTVLSNVLAIQESIAAMAVGVSSTPADASVDGSAAVVRKHSDLHAVGGRVKYILDTTEVIWGSLDASQHIDAAKRFLRAELVHEQLRNSFPKELLARFPLLGHQWPQVLKFRSQIEEAAKQLLESDRALQPAAAADALAALSALERLDAAAALQQLLAARHQWLKARLAEAAAGAAEQQGDAQLEAAGGSAEFAATVLADLVQAVQTTVAQVSQLFLATHAAFAALAGNLSAATPAAAPGTLLQQAAGESASDASELFFGGAYGLGEGSSSPEALEWEASVSGLLSALAPLPRDHLARACGAWLEAVAGSFSSSGLQLLGSCLDAEELRMVEAAVRAAIALWQPDAAAAAAAAAGGATGGAMAAQGSADPQQRRQQQQHSRTAEPASNQSVGAPGAAAEAGAQTWAVVAEKVMGRPLCMWKVGIGRRPLPSRLPGGLLVPHCVIGGLRTAWCEGPFLAGRYFNSFQLGARIAVST